MQDIVRVSAPQDLDGDVYEDGYEACVDVSWGRSRAVALPHLFFVPSLSPPINQALVTDVIGEPTQEDTLRRVYSYQPTAYWAGRLSSQLDRLAAEYPSETKVWRVEKAIINLNANAYGEGAKHSLDVCILLTLYSSKGYANCYAGLQRSIQKAGEEWS